MASTKRHWKLGLFVIVGLFVAFGTVVWLGAAELDKEVAEYVTYFDESVQGLDVGSPIKFRGVTIGTVARIGIAPDRRHVAVETEVDLRVLRSLGLDDDTLQVPDDLRVQLASAGVTGLKFLQVDFFNEESNPPPELSFETPSNYIPAAPSMLKSLEDSVVQSVGRFPETTEQAIAMIRRINVLLDDINQQKIPGRVATAVDNLNEALVESQKLVRLGQWKVTQLDVRAINDNAVQVSADLVEISAKTKALLDGTNGSIARINALIARAERKGGMVDNVDSMLAILQKEVEQLQGTMALVQGTMRSVKTTADSFSDVARNTSAVTDELGPALASIRQAAEAVQRVADALERDSDMLLKGRSEVGP